ncbi:MAG: sigma-54 dependent transcriptional regulator [Sandaracinaceae bacterium]|nr:sigma-54 dependent transcriptional regulator [Sandaracinaceae bacterium]
MSPPIVLVVDDKPNMLELLAKVLRKDARVLRATSGAAAIQILAEEPVSVVVSDLRMPDIDGLAVLEATRRLRPGAQFILMTAHASVPSAVEAMRRGAYDYVTKPFEPEHLRQLVASALGKALATPENTQERFEPLPGTVGRSPAMAELTRVVQRIARSDATVLVLGETGTGKELVARAIHTLSARASHRFVPLNCAAIPTELLESEIFGHARGAFSGAERERAGLFEEANGGSLFLDEIGELRPSLQAKLTRVLEERKVRRVGENRERAVDVRVVAATHRDIEAMVAAGTFREDLFYRLRVAVVRVPPLRERSGDIAALATHFLGEIAARDSLRLLGFSPQALEVLEKHSWPGNVRELRGVVERAAISADGPRIEVSALPPELAGASSTALAEVASMTYQAAVDAAREQGTRQYLQAVLERTGGKVMAAAEIAGIERESFYRLLRRYGVNPDDYRRRK